eukprot:186574-Amphidinium_carterae.2
MRLRVLSTSSHHGVGPLSRMFHKSARLTQIPPSKCKGGNDWTCGHESAASTTVVLRCAGILPEARRIATWYKRLQAYASGTYGRWAA